VYKTRAPKRVGTVPDEAEQDALRLRRQEALADELDARAYAAQVEIDIKTAQPPGLPRVAG